MVKKHGKLDKQPLGHAVRKMQMQKQNFLILKYFPEKAEFCPGAFGNEGTVIPASVSVKTQLDLPALSGKIKCDFIFFASRLLASVIIDARKFPG